MEFTFNNKSSRDFNIKIKKSNHLSIPRKKIEFVEVQGRTDNLIIDEGAREMLDIEIEAYIDCRNEDTYSYALRLDKWLNGVNGYSNLVFELLQSINASISISNISLEPSSITRLSVLPCTSTNSSFFLGIDK